MDDIKIIVPVGTTKKKKMLGRGVGTGHGGTSGKGNKGQNARAGGGVMPGFEGGQMPLYRRIARRGFSNSRFRTVYSIIHVGDLEKFEDGANINKEMLISKGLIHKKQLPVKVLGNGDITKKISLEVDKASKSAQEKIEKAGGTLIIKTKSEVDENGK